MKVAVKFLHTASVVTMFTCSSMALASPATPAAPAQICRTPGASDYPSSRLRVATHTGFARQHYPARLAEFARDPLRCGDIVFIGDSLTERFNLQPSIEAPAPVRNRGIAGDTSDGIIARLDELVAVRPRAVFIMIGTNDLWTPNSPRRVAQNVQQAILTLRTNNPELPIYIQTVLPVRSEPHLNRRVIRINAELVTVASAHNVTVIDTYSSFVDPSGLLAAPYTDDGVHLTAAGYARWADLLNGFLPGARASRSPE